MAFVIGLLTTTVASQNAIAWRVDAAARTACAVFQIVSAKTTWGRDLAARIANSNADEFLALLNDLDERRMSPTTRTAIALRILAVAEHDGTEKLEYGRHLRWLAGPFDDSAEPAFAAFFARRHALQLRPDPLVTKIAPLTLALFPRMSIAAAAADLVPPKVLLHPSHAPIAPARLASVTNELIELGAARDSPELTTTIGRMLAALPSPPIDQLLELLGNASTRPFACHALAAMGRKAIPAIDVLDELAAKNDAHRFLAAHTLTRIGPMGIARLAVLLPSAPELIGPIDTILRDGDPASICSAANVLLTLRPEPNPARAKTIRDAIAHADDARARALLTLALLRFDPVATDEDWLRIATLTPGLVRRRVLQDMLREKLTPLQIGVLAQLLGDADAGVREAAADALLVDPSRTATCKSSLQEYLTAQQGDDPATRARVQTALAALPPRLP